MPRRRVKVLKKKSSLTLDPAVLEELDVLAEETDSSRSEVADELLKAALDNKDLVDEVFPEEEEESEEEEPEEGEEEEEESEEED